MKNKTSPWLRRQPAPTLKKASLAKHGYLMYGKESDGSDSESEFQLSDGGGDMDNVDGEKGRAGEANKI